MVPFFETWWQGLVFGIVTTVGMLAICSAFALAWKKYETHGQSESQQHSCDVHH